MTKTKKRLVIAGVVVAVLAVLGPQVFKLIMMGPRNYFGQLRYDQRREGDLVVGDPAPDFVLTALDGGAPIRLTEHIGKKPLVLVFGSFT